MRVPMRRIVMFNWLTADGYFAGPDGNLDWVVPDEAQARAAARDIPGFDTVLFGRRTYELFEGFWRHALDDSATVPDPHRPGQRSREHRVIAVALNDFQQRLKHSTLEFVLHLLTKDAGFAAHSDHLSPSLRHSTLEKNSA